MKKGDGIVPTDTLMVNTMKCLVSDFQGLIQDPTLSFELLAALRSNNKRSIRESVPTPGVCDDTYTYKVKYQLQNFLKRHRFDKDTYTEDELQSMAIAKFVEVQTQLDVIKSRPHIDLYEAILDTASSYVTKVLGAYDVSEHRSACGFGTGASVGVLSREACEAQRWEAPVTGSANQISWFESHVVADNPHIQKYWNERMCEMGAKDVPYSQYREIDSLTMTLVPKTYKSLRSIMPDSTLGSYISSGLGRMMERRLKRNGYDISSLQMMHRSRAREASLTNCDVTLDLSSASDFISVDLVKRLLPPDWFDVLSTLRIGSCVLPDGTKVRMETFCTMGIGYTFPLETLVFLALLKAVERWTNSFLPRNWGRVSVYGDDMIFHRDMYPGVTRLFKYIGFVINFDKTFDEGPFRESCGGDFHCGVDVRPFQPEGDNTKVGLTAYTAILHKFINGLLRRWTEWEIPATLAHLVHCLERLDRPILIVPDSFPDESGVRCSSPTRLPKFLEGVRVKKPTSIGHGLYRFAYLKFTPELAKEERHEPYYWLAISSEGVHNRTNGYKPSDEQEVKSRLKQRVELQSGLDVPTPLLLENKKWIREWLPDRFIGPPQLMRVDPATYVTVRYSGSLTRYSGTSCFEEP